jgi:hypothetical protein
MNIITENIGDRAGRIAAHFRKVLSIIMFFPLAFVLLLYVYVGAELHLEVESTVSGSTQFFYPSKKGALSEDNSYVSNLTAGQTKLVVPVPLITQWLRWDPINGGPGEFKITSLYIKFPLINLPVHSEAVLANYQIDKVVERANGIFVATIKNAEDPSVRIQLPWQKILMLQLGVTFILTLLAFTVILMARRFLNQGRAFFAELVIYIRAEAEYCNKLPLLILIACFFWILSLTSYSISIDDEYAAFRVDHSVWVAQGRWTVYLLTKFILPQPAIPFLPHLIFCISVAISYLVILRAHQMKLDWKSILLYPIFMAFPIWYFISEFYANLLGASLGLILSSVALLIFSHSMSGGIRKKNLLMLIALQGGLLGTAIGAYQSYILAFFSMGLGLIVLGIVRVPHIPLLRIIKQVAYLSVVTCAGFALYQLVSFAFLVGMDKSIQYIDGFVNPSIFVEQPWHVINSTARKAAKIYAGSSAIFGVSLGAMGMLMALGLVALYSYLPDRKRRVGVLILVLGCIAAPFSLNLLAGGGGHIPYRSMVGVPYVIWFFAALTLYRKNTFINVLAVCAITASSFQLMNAHSTYSAATQLAIEHDKTLAAEIYHRILEKLPANDQLIHYKVDFYGAKSFNSIFPTIGTSTIGVSFFEWDGGNPHRIVTFMRLIGYDDMETINDTQRKELIKFYDGMPIWPSIGSIQQVDDVFLVKLGNRAGLTHQ